MLDVEVVNPHLHVNTRDRVKRLTQRLSNALMSAADFG
jgi:hypothetical protein